ncbi:MAG: hypothetical protein GY949_18860 [Gammaproteobacteria bacterium]|nr:hypothetical protein [Gammaproteobacteria bacterium]
MQPSLLTLGDDLIDRILDDVKRVLAEIGVDIRGPELKKRLLDHGLKTDSSGKRILFPQNLVDKAISDAPKSFTLFNRDGDAHTEIGGNNVNFVPGSSGINICDHVEETGRVRCVQRDRSPTNGSNVTAVSRKSRRSCRQTNDHFHDYANRQVPLRQRLLSEPARLCRSRYSSRDRAGNADGPHRASDAGWRSRFPLRRRPCRLDDGADHPAWRAGAVRRSAGDVSHESSKCTDGRDRSSAPQRSPCRDRQIAWSADAGLHGFER